MKKILLFLALSLLVSNRAGAAVYTWVGTTSDMSDANNWSPNDGPPFGDDTLFNSSATTKLSLNPNGFFNSNVVTFTGATFSFSLAAGGDELNIGAGSGALNLSSAASVNFSDQTININDAMTWSISGNSSLTSAGSVDTSNKLLNIVYGASQINTVKLSSVVFASTGSIVVTNWGGTLGAYGGANNQLRFSGDPTAYLGKISFAGYAGSTAAAQNMGGYFEVVAVPEPGTWALLAGGLTTVMVFRRRRQQV